MHTISVDFQVFKSLTARLEEEGQTHNDILRGLLGLDSIVEAAEPDHPLQWASDKIMRPSHTSGFFSRGLLLPSGTELRARYKGREYRASIVGDRWMDDAGREHSSPSSAANAITDNTVNGWRFWEGKRPGDLGWRRLDVIAAQPQ